MAFEGNVRKDGSPVDVTITVADGKGQPVTSGSVAVSASSGTINGKASDTLALGSSGQVHATYACDGAALAACKSGNNVSITASWNGVAGSQPASPTGNASVPVPNDGTWPPRSGNKPRDASPIGTRSNPHDQPAES